MLVIFLDSSPGTFYLVFYIFSFWWISWFFQVQVSISLLQMICHDLYYLLYQSYVSFGLFRHHLYAFLQRHWDKVSYCICIFVSIVCLVLPSDSSSVIWGHSYRLLYSWDSLYLVPYCTCTTLIKCHGGLMFCLCFPSSFV